MVRMGGTPKTRLAMATHMGLVPSDTRELDRKLVQSFNGPITKCEPAVARGSQLLHKRNAQALPMQSKLWA
jgi:hypothetical protein